MFYIGNFADMDTDESDTDNENPNVVLGTHDNLVITTVNEIDANDDGVINDDEFGTGDHLNYDTGNGSIDANLDNSSLYNAEILLGDGTTMSVTVLVIQADNGDVFISEDPAYPLDGLSIQSISLVSFNTSQAAGINSGASNVKNASVVCFGPETMIDTPGGLCAVETLRVGDFVMTRDHGPQPILWIRRRVYALDGAQDGATPVQINAGALGANLPARDLVVSPQHRILLGGGEAFLPLFDCEVFAAAKSLTDLPGVRYLKGKSQITWTHFACAQHEVITANGCLSESLLLGQMVVNAVSAPERAALTNLFGAAPTPDAALNGPPARKCLSVRTVKRQISRYLKGDHRAGGDQGWDRDRAMESHAFARLPEAVR
jgi:hypothetical protein